VAEKEGINMHKAYKDLTDKERKKILYGVSGSFEIAYIGKHDEGKTHKAKYE
jgi:excinuclease UvrABC ATPase subunit